jgi:indole-3-glycerol phosphate synthase
MNDFLTEMASQSRARAAAINGRFPASALDLPLHPLKAQGFDLIAEIKDSSPADGVLAESGANRAARARDYASGGAAAISVLTEPSKFAGKLQHLREVADAVSELRVPVMRKDFLVDPLQVTEARSAGASGVLLIAAMLPDEMLRAMLDCVIDHSMFALIESFDAVELQRCTALLEEAKYLGRAENGQLLVGVNTRNLRTLEVDSARLAELAPLLPEKVVCVAESGLKNTADVAQAKRLGYDMALIGTALMKSADPARLVADMLQAGRGAVPA